MKTIIYILLAYALPTSVLAQTPNKDTPVYFKGNYITWGDYTYTDNIKGLGALMIDLQKVNDELYNKMLPEYDLMVKRQREGYLVGGIGGTIGMGFILHGVLSSWNKDNNSPTGGSNERKPNYVTLTIGGILTTGSFIYANTKYVKRHDILHFTNQFNRLAKGDKLRFGYMPFIGLSSGLGGGVVFLF